MHFFPSPLQSETKITLKQTNQLALAITAAVSTSLKISFCCTRTLALTCSGKMGSHAKHNRSRSCQHKAANAIASPLEGSTA